MDKFGPILKTISLSQNLVLRVSDMKDSIKIFISSIFDQKYSVLEQIWSKNVRLFPKVEIWNLDQFEYAEFIGNVHFFHF